MFRETQQKPAHPGLGSRKVRRSPLESAGLAVCVHGFVRLLAFLLAGGVSKGSGFASDLWGDLGANVESSRHGRGCRCPLAAMRHFCAEVRTDGLMHSRAGGGALAM